MQANNRLKLEVVVSQLSLVDVSDIFYFFLLGEGSGSPRRQGGGDRFLIENPRRGGGVPGGGGAGRVSVANRGILGGEGGVNIFFSGPKRPPSKVLTNPNDPAVLKTRDSESLCRSVSTTPPIYTTV